MPPEPKYTVTDKVRFTRAASGNETLLEGIASEMLKDKVDAEAVDEFVTGLRNRKPVLVMSSSVHRRLAKVEQYNVLYTITNKKAVYYGPINEHRLELVKG